MTSLDTLVYHVCEKTSGFIVHIPDVAAVYAQILAANDSKYSNILLLPEYNGHAVWADESAWIIANFQDIPVMVDIAGGWAHQVTTGEIAALITAGVDVAYVRIAELVSYCLDNEVEFPDEYVAGMLEFCETNNIKVYWCEWKIDSGESVATFNKILESIEGYEGIVTVGFKTNSGDLEPAAGFKYVVDKGFTHVGATVESWYWETRHRVVGAPLSDPDNMPVSWMVCHAQEAVAAGVELIQFEAYWYFFSETTGMAKGSLKTLHYCLNSSMASMENSTVILQTLMAEWLNGPAKADVSWLDGRVSTVVGWDIQPSSFDFKNLTKKYAVSCYSLGCSGPNGKVWLKYEVVAVDVLVKVLGTTLDKASLIRGSMRVEVERILYMYSQVAPLWDPTPGPTGAYKTRRIPGLVDVVIGSESNPIEDPNFSRVTVQVKCRVFPKKSWV
jgi:hypothetical protein